VEYLGRVAEVTALLIAEDRRRRASSASGVWVQAYGDLGSWRAVKVVFGMRKATKLVVGGGDAGWRSAKERRFCCKIN
jgi:hypothetical protein